MTNTYDTSIYPLGSTHPKVLFNNASNLDDGAMNNRTSTTWVDREGAIRKSWFGIETDAANALLATGFEFIGDYDAVGELTFTRPNQVMSKAGEYWRPGAALTLPYTTVNNWVTDQPKFVSTGDASLRGALADPAQGVLMVASAGVPLAGIVNLQTVAQSSTRTYDVAGMISGTQFGGGSFRWDASVTKSLHDGRNVISPTVPWDGTVGTVGAFLDGTGETSPGGNGAFVRVRNAPMSLPELGATSAVASVALAHLIATGGLKNIPDGVWRMATQVVRDFSGDSGFPNTNEVSPRFVLRGDSISNTLLQFDGPSYAFNLTGSLNPPAGQTVLTQTELSEFSLKPSGALNSCNGIQMTNQAYVSLKDLNVEYCNIALNLNSVITSKLDNLFLRSNEIGLQLLGAGFSLPNALAMTRLTCQENRYAGILANRIGGGVSLDGATIEGNGTMGMAGTGGLIGNIDGNNGSATLQLSNVYFEGNKGDADLLLENVSAFTVTVILIGCNFHRISPVNYVTNNIKLSNTGGGKIRLIMIGCAFMTAGTYVANPARPYISHDQGSEVIDIGCSYNESTSLNHSIGASVSTVGRVAATGVPSSIPVGITSAKTGTGTYTVTSTTGWGVDVNGYVADATSCDGSARLVQRVVQDSATQFTVVTTDAAGAPADSAFNFSSVRVS